MEAIDDVMSILNNYSYDNPINYADLYRILKVDYGYTDEQIDNIVEYIIKNNIVEIRGNLKAYVMWLK